MNVQHVMLIAAALHFAFAAGEILPWRVPFILAKVKKKKKVKFEGDQLKLVATIVRNAGIYNLILAVGFLWSAFPGKYGFPIDAESIDAFRCYLLGGATLAGLFGLTLSFATILQAIVGIAGLLLIRLG